MNQRCAPRQDIPPFLFEFSTSWARTAGPTTRFILDGVQVIEEYDGSGAWQARYLYEDGIDRPRAMDRADVADVNGNANTTEVLRFHYHSRALGSVTEISQPTGAVVEWVTYDVYGAAVVRDRLGATVTSSAVGNPWLFTGREFDAESGLYHYRARAYDPSAGRFLQRDPLGFVDGLGLHEYVMSSPATLLDPRGETAMGVLAGARACFGNPGLGWLDLYGGAATDSGPDIAVPCSCGRGRWARGFLDGVLWSPTEEEIHRARNSCIGCHNAMMLYPDYDWHGVRMMVTPKVRWGEVARAALIAGGIIGVAVALPVILGSGAIKGALGWLASKATAASVSMAAAGSGLGSAHWGRVAPSVQRLWHVLVRHVYHRMIARIQGRAQGVSLRTAAYRAWMQRNKAKLFARLFTTPSELGKLPGTIARLVSAAPARWQRSMTGSIPPGHPGRCQCIIRS